MLLSQVDPTLLGVMITACGTLGSAVGFLYKQMSSFHKETGTKLAECEKDRIVLHEQQSQLWAELARQAGRKLEDLKREMDSK